jgi:hypothetical protein
LQPEEIGMFFLISGSSAAGKSTASRLLGERLDRVECHDADEMVARTADERCEQLELWVQRALETQASGRDFLLSSNSPLGELLACPSAPLLDGIAACLLDCSDEVREARYFARGALPDWPFNQAILNWAAWHRGHAVDPGWEPHVIDRNGPPTHRYDRWRSWERGDPRWQVLVLDTTDVSVEATLSRLVDWVRDARLTPSPLALGTRWDE